MNQQQQQLQATQSWLESSAAQALAIWCSEPETHSEKSMMGVGQKTYHTYRISYRQVGRDLVTARHRYSEFESVRKDLRDRYHPMGILVPSLPPKSTLTVMSMGVTGGNSKSDQFFIKERTFGLTLFCESVIAVPFLRFDASWRAFLRPQMGSYAGALPEDIISNEGELQLISLLRPLEVPYKYTMNSRIEEIKEEMAMIERQAKFLLDKVRALQSCEAAVIQAREAVRTGMQSWFDAERLHIKSMNGRIYNENEPVLQPGLSAFATAQATNTYFSAAIDHSATSAESFSYTLIAFFEQELGIVESFRELFRVHEELVKSIENVTGRLAKAEGGKASNRSEQIQEYKQSLEEKVTCLNAFYKGFSYITLPMIARHRAAACRRLISCFVSSQQVQYVAMQQICLDFFQTLQISSATASEEMRRLYGTVDAKPLARVPLPDIPNAEDMSITGMFLNAEQTGLSGLFQRALVISKPPTEASQGSSTTHLFTSSVHNTMMANAAAAAIDRTSLGDNGGLAPAPSAGTGTTGRDSFTGQSGNAANPLARRGSAVAKRGNFLNSNGIASGSSAGQQQPRTSGGDEETFV